MPSLSRLYPWLMLGREQYWLRTSYFLPGSGRTHVSRSLIGSGFGMKSIAITKLLAGAHKSAHDGVMILITNPNEATCA